ncbi:monovalent cation/H+ antiporter subunit D [Steroidobacter denitrificans]|uniref:Monovalent cation/H+ antiporter subunit D n=1 Tax=Steroidobacter denitrificans TaxID=465721 RepID=A0A127F6A4_STEDE|nr:monovalent cation/H+ antiporter subunit D [Steroidobacter denitrificans]AMN45937.1 monovalent cation/H+ antiporter subunit D [Steroidobacter denitrificans]
MNMLLMHLPVLPIVVPLLAGALMLMLAESRRVVRVSIALTAMLLQFVAACTLLYLTTDSIPHLWSEGVGVYTIGDWAAPFGIVLVVDRLTALMLALGASVGLASLVYSLARWDRLGPHYHSLFQFLLMGLNGAFLTGDLFNLFVFFEVLLASSYGLVLHGSGKARVKAGLHYIVVNLASSLLFLIGVALIYGVTGTLNMADLAGRIAALTPQDRPLFEAGATVLAVAFLVKAGSWPLNFWLPGTYAAAGAPVAAAFSLMTKVGIYALIRIGTLIGASDADATFIGTALFYAGMATLVVGTIGLLAAQHLGRLVGFSVIVSSGTLLAAVGFSSEVLTAPALFYLLTSVLATSAFFILTGMTERTRTQFPPMADAAAAPLPAISYEAFGVRESPDSHSLDDEVGIAIPAVMAFLGLSFVCCVLLISGLPPLSGFIAKFALLSAIFNTGFESAPTQMWSFMAAIIVAGFAALIALTRVGMRLFWTNVTRTTPRLRIIEAAPVAFLLLLTMGLTVAANPVMIYLDAAARSLHDPETYIRVVLSSRTHLAPVEASQP